MTEVPVETHPGSDHRPQAVIATGGEVFRDGDLIELVWAADGSLALMHFVGDREVVASSIEHGGLYHPMALGDTLLRAINLPTESKPHVSTRKLFEEVIALVATFVGLSGKPALVVSRFILSTWVIEALPAAPVLVITGQDGSRAERLLDLMRCLCRHALRISGVTPASLCSLPSRMHWTLLIDQPSLSDRLTTFLRDISRPSVRVPVRGRLVDLFGAQVIRSESLPRAGALSGRAVEIPLMPGTPNLPILDADARRRLTEEFQAKLLGFRRANLTVAGKLQFDASKLEFSIRELAQIMAAATPDDLALQSEVADLLRDEAQEAIDHRWIELSSIATEAVIVACRKSSDGVAYVSEIARMTEEIAIRRGEKIRVDNGRLGKWLRANGFAVEPRDARGSKMRLTKDVLERARQLARDLGAPGSEVPDPSSQSAEATSRTDNVGCVSDAG